MMALINEANETLSDTKKKKEYDVEHSENVIPPIKNPFIDNKEEEEEYYDEEDDDKEEEKQKEKEREKVRLEKKKSS